MDWTEVTDPIVPEPRGRTCEVGPSGHTWTLQIEEGKVGMSSGCDECTNGIFAPTGGEELFMQAIPGRLVFRPEHEHLGGWHGFTRCDCGWQWEFVPDRPEVEFE